MPVHSSTTIGFMSRNEASFEVAAMHWLVSTPVTRSVSVPSPRRITSRFVLKNALRRIFSTIQSCSAGGRSS